MKKSLSLLVLIFSSGFASAQSEGMSLNHVTLVVSDFEASKKFYTQVLRFEEIEASWLPDNQMFISLGGGLELHIGEVDGVEIDPNGFNHIAFSVEKFDEFLEYLRSAGVVYTSLGGGDDYFVATRPDDVRQTWIADPDGYMIEINDAK